MITVSTRQLDSFRAIRDAFPNTPKVPPEGAWKAATDEDIWLRVVSQVVVAGRAAPAERLKEPAIAEKIAWSRLADLPHDEAREVLWMVLREIKTRYAGKTVVSCRKTTAVLKNLNFLKSYSGGPRAFLAYVAGMDPDNDRLRFLVDHLSYFKERGARDFLVSGFGILRNSIAIDKRIRNILAHIGISVPDSAVNSEASYSELENDLLHLICRPLELSGAEFDQLLFLNYEQIVARNWQ